MSALEREAVCPARPGWLAAAVKGLLLTCAVPDMVHASPKPLPQVLEALLERAERPETLYRISHQDREPAELLALVSLQGLMARKGSENLYLDAGASGYAEWLKLAQAEFGVRVVDEDDAWELLGRFSAAAAGYVLCALDDEVSVQLAAILAGALDAVIIDSSLEERARGLGWKLLQDTRGRDFAWLDSILGGRQAPPVLILQRRQLVWELKDFAVFLGAEVLSASQPEAAAARIRQLAHPAALAFGWGDSRIEHEDAYISRTSDLGVSMIPADYARNLPVFAGLRDTRSLRQAAPACGERAASGPVHTVAFVFTDGDNLNWLLYDFPTDPRWFGSPQRGRIPLGWGMAPALATLFPPAVDWYYRKASNNPGARDVFLAGPSGNGYFYPSRLPPGVLQQHADASANLMERAGLDIVQILDFDALDRLDLWDAYTRHDGIRGLLYMDYVPYDKHRGRIVWSNGKPVISAAAKLWRGAAGSDADSVVQRLNAAPRRPDLAEGYSIVVVHAWSFTVADVVEAAQRLDAGVEVVAPDVLFQRVRDNLHPAHCQ